MQADSRSPVPLSSGKRFPNPAGNLMLVQEIPKHDVTLVVLGPRLIKKKLYSSFNQDQGSPFKSAPQWPPWPRFSVSPLEDQDTPQAPFFCGFLKGQKQSKANKATTFCLLPAPQFLILPASPWLLLAEASLGPAFPMLQPSLGAKQYCLLSPVYIGLIHSSFLKVYFPFPWGSVCVVV